MSTRRKRRPDPRKPRGYDFRFSPRRRCTPRRAVDVPTQLRQIRATLLHPAQWNSLSEVRSAHSRQPRALVDARWLWQGCSRRAGLDGMAAPSRLGQVCRRAESLFSLVHPHLLPLAHRVDFRRWSPTQGFLQILLSGQSASTAHSKSAGQPRFSPAPLAAAHPRLPAPGGAFGPRRQPSAAQKGHRPAAWCWRGFCLKGD